MITVDALEDEGFTVLEAAPTDDAWPLIARHGDIGVRSTDVAVPGQTDDPAVVARFAEHWSTIREILISEC